MEIGSISNIIQDLSLNSKNVSGEKKSNTTFEEIIKNEKNTNKVVEESNATENKDKIFYRNTKINGIEIYGNFIIVAKDKKGFVSLTDEQIKEIKYIFGRKD